MQIYIAGPFRDDSAWEVESNIRRAESLALEVWRIGNVAVLCPHANTRFFPGALPDEVWLSGDLEMLRRSDAVMLTPDWKRSSGATKAVEFAHTYNIPVFESLERLKLWLHEGCTSEV